MKRYEITYARKDEKEKNIALLTEVRDNGTCLKGGWSGDYWVNIFDYKNKIYEIWYNEELGIMSEVIEYDKDEYKDWLK